MYILGINSAYHESSACLLKDGKLLCAAEEERFNRIKHGKRSTTTNGDNLPMRAANWCMASAGITWRDVDHLAFSFDREERRERNLAISPPVGARPGDWGTPKGEQSFYESLERAESHLRALASKAVFHQVSHHMSHAGSAFYVSPFEEACVLAVDGIAEFSSTWMGLGRGKDLKCLHEVDYPNSIGFLWEKFSEFLGFDRYSGPGKVMGYSAITDAIGPSGVDYLSRMEKVIGTEGMGFAIDPEVMRFRTQDFSGMEALFGPRRSSVVYRHEEASIAAALQTQTERIVVHLAQELYERVEQELGRPVKNLTMAGGVTLNCLANAAILRETPFENLFIQPAANDAGTALGAAFHVWHAILGNEERRFVMEHAFWGPEYDEEEMSLAMSMSDVPFERIEDPHSKAAELIAAGKIVARFDGAMEWGPRALGNRSILADPTRFDMREIINARVKYRESFRPFAPAARAERVEDHFHRAKATWADEFMLLVHPLREREHLRLPAVVQEDEATHRNTARLQLVRQETNPGFHRILSALEDRTGVGVVLNTSFNVGEPIICNPRHAVRTFLSSGIDHLVMGPFLASRSE